MGWTGTPCDSKPSNREINRMVQQWMETPTCRIIDRSEWQPTADTSSSSWRRSPGWRPRKRSGSSWSSWSNTTSITPLPPVSHAQALDYLKGIKTHEGAAVFYQRNDGQSGKHWRNLDMRRNPGVTGDGWQVRRFNPNDPSAAVAIALTEGEKGCCTTLRRWPDCLHRAQGRPKPTRCRLHRAGGAGQGNPSPHLVERR